MALANTDGEIASRPEYGDADKTPRTRIGTFLNPDRARVLKVVSWGAIVAWCAWWGASIHQNTLIGAKRAWFAPPYFGIDYLYNVDYPTRVWLSGKDPYEDKSHLFVYPPPVTRMFAWCKYFTPEQSLVIWIVALGLMAAGGAWAACVARRRLGLSPIPVTTAIAAIGFSTPVVFAMERGNYDLVTVPLVIAALAIMKKKTWWADVLGGAILAIAPWAKIYPGLLGVGLVGLRRWGALASFVACGAAIGLATLEENKRFLVNNDHHLAITKYISDGSPEGAICPWNHSLTDHWKRIWARTPLRPLRRIDGRIAAALILGPPLVWVSWHVFRCTRREKLAFPYLMWVVALATFVPPVSNDYSLFFLPLTALAVWDRRDPLLIQLTMYALVLWWQPIGLPINGRLLILVKIAGLLAMGVSLAERALEQQAALLAGGAEKSPAGATASPLPLAA